MKQIVLSVDEIRQVEKAAQQDGVGESLMMERAAAAVLRVIQLRYPSLKALAIFAGPGNNGGDGFVLARLAFEAGLRVWVYSSPMSLGESMARKAARQAIELLDIHHEDWSVECHSEVELIVDALLGTGGKSDRGLGFLKVVERINQSSLPVVAIDVPTGLDADTGCMQPMAVRADLTVTFIALKLGLLTADGPDVVGEVICDDLGLTAWAQCVKPTLFVLDELQVRDDLPARKRNSHKNRFGRLLIAGGEPGMGGAVFLAAKAALSVGAGVIDVGIHPTYATSVWTDLPEVMVHAIHTAADIKTLAQRCDVCLIGPGLGGAAWGRMVFDAVLQSKKTIVVDASAFQFLKSGISKHQDWVLTPHPGEAATLLGCSTAEVVQNRRHALNQLYKKYGGRIVLKGAGTLIKTKEKEFVCTRGSPALATPGTGDILAGTLAGLIAQGVGIDEATLLGVWLNAVAGERFEAQVGDRGLNASELPMIIRHLVNS